MRQYPFYFLNTSASTRPPRIFFLLILLSHYHPLFTCDCSCSSSQEIHRILFYAPPPPPNLESFFSPRAWSWASNRNTPCSFWNPIKSVLFFFTTSYPPLFSSPPQVFLFFFLKSEENQILLYGKFSPNFGSSNPSNRFPFLWEWQTSTLSCGVLTFVYYFW